MGRKFAILRSHASRCSARYCRYVDEDSLQQPIIECTLRIYLTMIPASSESEGTKTEISFCECRKESSRVEQQWPKHVLIASTQFQFKYMIRTTRASASMTYSARTPHHT